MSATDTTANRPLATMFGYWRMLLHDNAALVSAVILLIVLMVSYVGPYFVPRSALTLSFSAKLHPPLYPGSGIFGLMGTDLLGRSVLGRLIIAGQTSLTVAIVSAFAAALIGGAIGVAAGYRGGIPDSIAMRVADVILSFPMLLLAIVFLYILKPSINNVILLLAIGRLPLYLRVARAETLEVKSRLFVDAARCLGTSPLRICLQEIVPVIAPNALTLVALDVGLLMLTESSLSFLGIGIQPPALSWGLMVSDGRQFVGSAWWLTVFPGLAIFLTALCCNLFANWLRIALDPVQRWRLQSARPRVAAVAASSARAEQRGD